MRTLRSRWLGRVPYGEATDLQRALHERTTDDYLLLLEHPHVYTLGTRADPAHVLVPPAQVGAEPRDGRPRWRRHLPRSRPARRLPDRHAGRVARRARRRRRVRPYASSGCSSTSSPTSASRQWATRMPPACGSATRRSPRSASRSPGVAPGTGSRSTSIPTSRCSTTSSRAASPTAGVTSMARVLGTAPAMTAVVDAVGRPVRRRPRLPRDRPPVRRRHPLRILRASDARPDDVRRSVTCSERRARRSRGAGAVAGAARGGGGGGAGDRRVGTTARAAGVDEGAGRPRGGLPGDEAAHAGAVAHHGLRGGGLPQHLRVLGRPHRHLHGAGRALHAGLRVLPRRHPPPARARGRRAGPGRRRGGHARPRARGRHERGPRRPARRRCRALRRDHRGHPGPRAAHHDRSAHPRLQGRRHRARRDPRRASRRAEPQPRDRRPAPARGASRRGLRALADGAGPRARRRDWSRSRGSSPGMGETDDEMRAAITDLRNVGVEVLTIGQYLRPSPAHAPVVRWWTPTSSTRSRAFAEGLGFAHVECGPLVRSSYHAKRAVDTAHAAASSVGADRLMGRVLDGISAELAAFLEAQPVFFVATAPNDPDAFVNCSPKGLDTFRVLDAHTVAYLDLTGQRRRDDRPPARQRPHHADVLRVHRSTRHRAAARARALRLGRRRPRRRPSSLASRRTRARAR